MECDLTINCRVRCHDPVNLERREAAEEATRTSNVSKVTRHFTNKIMEYRSMRRKKCRGNSTVDVSDLDAGHDTSNTEASGTSDRLGHKSVRRMMPAVEEMSFKRTKKASYEDDAPIDEGEDADRESNTKNPSKRRIKKEKAVQRESVRKEALRLEAMHKALGYVSKWKHARSEWKFMKVRQIWLIENIFDETLIPNEAFPNVLEYFEGCKGMAKQQLLKKGMDVVRRVEECEENREVTLESTEYKRARELLQALPMET